MRSCYFGLEHRILHLAAPCALKCVTPTQRTFYQPALYRPLAPLPLAFQPPPLAGEVYPVIQFDISFCRANLRRFRCGRRLPRSTAAGLGVTAVSQPGSENHGKAPHQHNYNKHRPSTYTPRSTFTATEPPRIYNESRPSNIYSPRSRSPSCRCHITASTCRSHREPPRC